MTRFIPTPMRLLGHAGLLAVSIVSDLLDLFVLGQVPGIGWVLDAPMLFFHFVFAGPIALLTIPEIIPGIGTIPAFTLATLGYCAMYDFSARNRLRLE